MSEDALAQGAEAFALRRAGRSPRVAKQYIDWLATKS
jgi:predicted AAA+ superfamily ATPase